MGCTKAKRLGSASGGPCEFTVLGNFSRVGLTHAEPSTQVPRTCLLVGGQVGTAHSHTKMTNPTPQQPTYMWRAHGHAHACTWAHETYGRNCTARITLNMEQYGAEPPLSRLPCIGMHDLMFPDPSCVSRVGSRGMLVRTPPSSSVTAASCRYYRTVGSSRGWR